MKIRILNVGKTADANLDAAIGKYIKRLAHYLPVEYVELRIPKAKNNVRKSVKKNEGDILLSNIAAGETTVLLDENGKQFTSRELAHWLNKKMNSGTRSICFVTGGPFGFSDEMISKAEEKISLSKFTFTHEMSRLILAEQLYRALTILKGEAYHHD